MTNFPWPRFEELLEKDNLTPEEKRELDSFHAWVDRVADQRQQEEWDSRQYMKEII